MAEFTYRDITGFINAPMHYLRLIDPTTADKIHLINPTSDSAWGIQDISRQGGDGALHTTGWIFNCNFKMVMNPTADMLQRLDGWNAITCNANLVLKPDSSQIHGRYVNLQLEDVRVAWRVAKGQYGPEITVRLVKPLLSLYQYVATSGSVTLWLDNSGYITEPP